VIETTSLLRAYADLILKLSGAGSVTVAVCAPREDESPTHVTEGELAPVDELQDEESVRRIEVEFWTDRKDESTFEAGPARFDGAANDSILFRIPGLRDLPDSAVDNDRRRADVCHASSLAVWIGLRLRAGADRAANGGLPDVFSGTPGSAREDAWNRILGLAASLAPHAHAIAKVFQDPLTGLPARSGFRTELNLALDECRANRSPLALMLINPDDYAEVNRIFDRSVGDSVLVEIAGRLRRRVRSTDRLARYGGATFAIILQGVDSDSAERVAGEIGGELAERPYHDGAVPLSFSAGLAHIDPDEEYDGDLVAEWTRRADEALFQAKLEGGACTTTWSETLDGRQARTVDRLQGMFTGDVNTDYRNMALLWEVVQSIADGGEPEDLCCRVSEGLSSWLRARIVAIVEPSKDGTPQVLYATVDGEPPDDEWRLDEAARAEIDHAMGSREARIPKPKTAPEQRPVFVVPLLVGERCTGCIYVEGDSRNSTDETPDPRFLTALAAQLAIALDRTRLNAIERERETERREILESEVKELRRVLHSTRLSYTSDSMRAVLETARRIAPTDATVLITGESGTGKELLARTIHQLSDRRDQPMIVVDCGAIASSLIDSELFGHVKGAFTGAHARKTGRLVEADGATVFLDEIAELPIDVQSRLLRFVQERQVTPVGGTRPVEIDARIIAATNKDLSERAKAGTFREDLYHRLNVVSLHLPPLRERKGDIPHLAGQFLQQYASLYRKDGLRLAPETERALKEHRWAGNVRELQNRMMRAVLFADDGVIRPEHFEGLQKSDGPWPDPGDTASSPSPSSPVKSYDSAEAELREALGREVDRALADGAAGRPLGKWLEADLIVAADRASEGVGRRAGALLGMADTTYRRRLDKAERDRQAGLEVRSETWDEVRAALELLVSAVEDSAGDLAARVERIALEAIAAPCGNDLRTGAQLLGVTEPTYLKRRTILGIGSVTA
jgi:diguanylate cyclase (GGDEF)-like protein